MKKTIFRDAAKTIESAMEDIDNNDAEDAARKMFDLLNQGIKSSYIYNTLACAYLLRHNAYRAIENLEKSIKLKLNNPILGVLIRLCESKQMYEKSQHYSLVRQGFSAA